MGHSLGTTVCHGYLADAGARHQGGPLREHRRPPATAPPGGVPTLALWAGAVDRPVQGADRRRHQRHDSEPGARRGGDLEESFLEIFRFFRGRAPFTSRILPPALPRISGRAVNFPDNAGLEGATLEIWRVRPHRRAQGPQAEGDLHARSRRELRAGWTLIGTHHEFAVLQRRPDGLPLPTTSRSCAATTWYA